MASGYNAGRFNLALAAGAGSAVGFALLAMPRAMFEGGLEELCSSAFISSPPEPATRIGIIFASAILSLGLVWLVLRSCDQPRKTSAGVVDEQDEWIAPWVTGPEAGNDPMYGDAESDDPFADLARHASPLEGPLELRAEDALAEPGKAPEPLSTRELLARLPSFAPADASGRVQRLDAGLAESEWPLPADQNNDAFDAVDDRLRVVLHDLQAMTRSR
jgi:hypothetical protein